MALDFGTKITIPGQDTTSSDPRAYAFWSKYPIMKTYLVGTYSYTFPSDLSSVTITITHNLGHAKGIWFSFDGSAQNAQWVGVGFWAFHYISGANTASRFWAAYSNANDLQIKYSEGNQAGSGYNTTGEVWNFKYYIFIENVT